MRFLTNTLTNKHVKWISLLTCICILLCSATIGKIYAQETTAPEIISLEDVLKSSAEHFPAIRSALADINIQKGTVQESLGAFDAQLESAYYSRLEGFYDGQLTETKVTKPFQDFGAKASIGYRISDGDFPVYEDYNFTNDGGEFNASLSFSLLRGRDIDLKRFKLNETTLKLDQAEIKVLEKQLGVQLKAYKAYLDWVSAGYKYDVYQSLLNIAIKREKAFKEKVKQGDLPKIILTENKQFILQRREIVLDAERELTNAANILSLFLRDDDGNMINVKGLELPKKFPDMPDASLKTLEERIDYILNDNPALRQLELDKAMADNDIKMGENNILPAFDVQLGVANDFGDSRSDFGSGGTSREDFESTALVSLSVPLQKRLGQGRINQGKAKKRKTELDQQLLQERLRTDFKNILNNLDIAQKLVKITRNEISVTNQMTDAERIRFENGQSDFFLINVRETNAAKAQIKNIDAQKYNASTYATYLAMALDFEQLHLN